MTEQKKTPCDDCGVENEDVKKTFCPYSAEINNEEVEVYLCPECYTQRAMEI